MMQNSLGVWEKGVFRFGIGFSAQRRDGKAFWRVTEKP